MTTTAPSKIRLITDRVDLTTIQAYRCGLVGSRALESAISDAILNVLQTRQRDDLSVVVDFDICELRLAVFDKLTA